MSQLRHPHGEQFVVRGGRRYAVHVELLQLRAVDGNVSKLVRGKVTADVDIVYVERLKVWQADFDTVLFNPRVGDAQVLELWAPGARPEPSIDIDGVEREGAQAGEARPPPERNVVEEERLQGGGSWSGDGGHDMEPDQLQVAHRLRRDQRPCRPGAVATFEIDADLTSVGELDDAFGMERHPGVVGAVGDTEGVHLARSEIIILGTAAKRGLEGGDRVLVQDPSRDEEVFEVEVDDGRVILDPAPWTGKGRQLADLPEREEGGYTRAELQR